jgi:hypothetical protein
MASKRGRDGEPKRPVVSATGSSRGGAAPAPAPAGRRPRQFKLRAVQAQSASPAQANSATRPAAATVAASTRAFPFPAVPAAAVARHCAESALAEHFVRLSPELRQPSLCNLYRRCNHAEREQVR